VEDDRPEPVHALTVPSGVKPGGVCPDSYAVRQQRFVFTMIRGRGHQGVRFYFEFVVGRLSPPARPSA
jgi:hypothetical protein